MPTSSADTNIWEGLKSTQPPEDQKPSQQDITAPGAFSDGDVTLADGRQTSFDIFQISPEDMRPYLLLVYNTIFEMASAVDGDSLTFSIPQIASKAGLSPIIVAGMMRYNPRMRELMKMVKMIQVSRLEEKLHLDIECDEEDMMPKDKREAIRWLVSRMVAEIKDKDEIEAGGLSDETADDRDASDENDALLYLRASFSGRRKR